MPRDIFDLVTVSLSGDQLEAIEVMHLNISEYFLIEVYSFNGCL